MTKHSGPSSIPGPVALACLAPLPMRQTQVALSRSPPEASHHRIAAPRQLRRCIEINTWILDLIVVPNCKL